MTAEIRVFANTVPAICLVLGFILIFYGYTTGNETMVNSGWTFVIIGVILQILWLILIRRKL